MIPESTIHATLEKELQTRVPVTVWNKLVRANYVQDVQNGEEGAWGELVRECRELLEIAGLVAPADASPTMLDPTTNFRLGSPTRPQDPTSIPTLEDREQVISVLVWEEVVLRSRDLTRFQMEVLNNEVLPVEQVELWIQQRLAEDAAPNLWVTDVPIPPDHQVIEAADAWIIQPPLKVTRVPKMGDDTRRPVQVSPRFLQYIWHVPPDRWGRRYCPTAQGTTLDWLRELSEQLADRYCWTVDQATTFILTGFVPWIHGTRATYRYRPIPALTRIELSLDPTLSVSEVADLYREARKHVLSGKHRSLSNKHLALAFFTAWRAKGEPWTARMKAWNAAHPEWKYIELRNFRRDCRQARDRLLAPILRNNPYQASPTEGGDHGEARQQ